MYSRSALFSKLKFRCIFDKFASFSTFFALGTKKKIRLMLNYLANENFAFCGHMMKYQSLKKLDCACFLAVETFDLLVEKLHEVTVRYVLIPVPPVEIKKGHGSISPMSYNRLTIR